MVEETTVETVELRGGRACLDFANTVASRRDSWGPDRLGTYADLIAWAERLGVVTGAEASSLSQAREPAAALSRAKELREAIYGVFAALSAGDEPAPDDLNLIAASARRAGLCRRLSRTVEGGFTWAWSDEIDEDAIAGRVAHDAADLLTDLKRLPRVRECLGRNCGWLFLDTTRNGGRRWCSEAECGTLDRVTRHRARRRGVAEIG